MLDRDSSFPTGIPIKDSDEMYLQFMMNNIHDLKAILMNAKGDTNIYDCELGARSLIASMVDEKRKTDLREKFSNKVNYIKNLNEIDNDDKTYLIKLCCVQVIDECMSFMDDLLGLVRQNVVYDIIKGDESFVDSNGSDND